MADKLKSVEDLKSALLDIGWDCQSGWLGSNGVESWDDDRVKKTCEGIIVSFTKSDV